MREITAKERSHGMKYCTFCKPKKVKATYRDHLMNFSCEIHKGKLITDHDRMTEADYMSWNGI